jgi:class 3 adenylate cyclase/tetratricopeptide (TPR) repeat protein
MTTENVAILFTDIVGSTELSQRLSPEGADEVRRGHFSILRQAIAQKGGTEVKNVGDGVMAVFGSASAALGCAVAMQQGVEQDNRKSRHPAVGLRIGLSGGEVVPEDNDYWGDSVIEAARLCALCEGGQILASDVVRLTAGRRSPHQCRSVGALSLKGLPDPVGTVEVLWEPLDGVDAGLSIPLPSPLAVRPAMGVVGRGTEVGLMIDATKRVATGEGREVLLVSGEAGLGKTTLVSEAARSAFDYGACVLFGHCEEDLATPYQLFAEALGHYVTHANEEDLLAHVAEHGSELARLLPALGRRLPGLPPSKATDSDTERFLLFAAVVGLLATASANQPVVIVLDDLQWADTGSLLLLRHVAAANQTLRVLVLGTYRDSELSGSHPMVDALAALHRQNGVSRISLTGLDETEVLALLEAMAGYDLDDAGANLAHAVCQETDGNPFFVSEVLRHLSETGAIYQDATGRWTAKDSLDEIALPDSVREVIGARVGRLGQDAGRVLAVASVIGRDFDLDLLARSARVSEDDLLDILEAAAAVALVREPTEVSGRYSFAHALIQHTISEDMGPNRRARAHRHVAEALEDLCGGRPGARVGELARHWVAATQPMDRAKAIDYSRQAGDAALRALAPDEALRYYTQALDLSAQADKPDPVLALDLAIGLGSAQRQVGDPEFRETLLKAAYRASELGETQRLVTSALVNDRGFRVLGSTDGDKMAVLEVALARLPGDHPDRALLLANLCKELPGDCSLERRRALSDEALAIAEASRDETNIVRVLNQVSLPLRVPPLLDQSLSRSADALARAERIGDPVLLFEAAAVRNVTAVQAGDVVEVDRSIEIARALASRLNQPTISWVLAIEQATRSLISGNTDRAEQLATEALKIGNESGQPDAALFFGAQYFGVSWQRGTLSDLVPLIEQTIAQSPSFPLVLAALALAHAEGGRIGDARQLLADDASSDLSMPLTSSWLTNRTLYAEAAIQCRDAESAVRQSERLAPWASQFSAGGLSAEGPVSHYLGGLGTVLGRYDEAEAYFVQSAAMSDKMGSKFFAARTDLSWGRMLAERQAPGDIEKARDLLKKALTVAAAHGYGTVERRAVAALQLIDA